MATIIGGTRAFPGRDNRLIGTDGRDVIFGDPFTTGYGFGVPEIGASLSSGTGGNDRLEGRGDDPFVEVDDIMFGDAFEMAGTGRGGRDVLLSGLGGDHLSGDARQMFGAAQGGNDRIATGPSGPVDEGDSGSDLAWGDAVEMHDRTRGGDDELRGGPTRGEASTTCRLSGDASLMDGNARGGDDTLLAGPATFTSLVGDALQMSGSARGGGDRLTGGVGADVIEGDGGFMFGAARGGRDKLAGGRGDDNLTGDAFGMFDSARGGDDELAGGLGDDTLAGDAREVQGFVRCGADRLDGGKGDDLLYGDLDPGLSLFGDVARGVDTFVFRPGDGHDTIGDFQVGRDRIVLVGLDPAEVRDARVDATLLSERGGGGAGGDTVIDLGAAAGDAAGVDTLTLVGVTDLRASDFVVG